MATTARKTTEKASKATVKKSKQEDTTSNRETVKKAKHKHAHDTEVSRQEAQENPATRKPLKKGRRYQERCSHYWTRFGRILPQME